MKKDMWQKRKILSSSIKVVLSTFENNVFYFRYRHQTSKASSFWKQKYSRLRCLLVKGLVICFYFGWSGSILHFRQNIIKVGSKSWLLTCSSNITLSLTPPLWRDLVKILTRRQRHSSSFSLECADFKNVIFENISLPLSEVAEVAEVKRPRNPKRQKF